MIVGNIRRVYYWRIRILILRFCRSRVRLICHRWNCATATQSRWVNWSWPSETHSVLGKLFQAVSFRDLRVRALVVDLDVGISFKPMRRLTPATRAGPWSILTVG